MHPLALRFDQYSTLWTNIVAQRAARRMATALQSPRCPSTSMASSDLPLLCDGIVLPVSLIGKLATQPDTIRTVLDIVKQLQPDDYTQYTARLYQTGLDRFGNQWNYADIATALYASTTLVQPRRYLEIGVRQGRSMAIVASVASTCQLVGFDMWMDNYGHAPNPGPQFVQAQLEQCGFRGSVEFVSGNSHQTLPQYFRAQPQAAFDLITVDGDHSRAGAIQDLCDVLPHLAIGGVLIFDDIAHPAHPYLRGVWQQCVAQHKRFSCWSFDELGYGVAIAIRRW